MQTSSERRRKFTLTAGVIDFVQRYGLERCGFLTLTFADDLQWSNSDEWAEAARRWHKLVRRDLSSFLVDWGRVVEAQKSGRLHFHCVVALREDIRTGFDFEEYRRRVEGHIRFRASDVGANNFLRHVWAVIRQALPRHGFGRSELTPLREESEAVASYVGKYVAGGKPESGAHKFKGRRVSWAQGVGRGNSYRANGAWVWSGEGWRCTVAYIRAKMPARQWKLLRGDPHWAFKNRDRWVASWMRAGSPGAFLVDGAGKGLAGLPVAWRAGVVVLVVGAVGSASAGELGALVKEFRVNGLRVRRLDADRDRIPVSDLNLQVVPAVVVMKNGVEMRRWCGARSSNVLVPDVLSVCRQAERIQPQVDAGAPGQA